MLLQVVGNAKYSDIDMSVTDPTGRVVLEELRSRGNMEGEHNELHNDEDHEDSLVKVRESGDYKVCFGNKQTVSPSFQKRLHLDIGPMLNIKFKNSRKDDLPEEQTERIFVSTYCWIVLVRNLYPNASCYMLNTCAPRNLWKRCNKCMVLIHHWLCRLSVQMGHSNTSWLATAQRCSKNEVSTVCSFLQLKIPCISLISVSASACMYM